MKNISLYSGIFLLFLAMLMSCDLRSPSQKHSQDVRKQSTEKARNNTAIVLDNSQTSKVIVESVASLRYTTISKVTVDGVIYIVASNRYDGGVDIIKHEPVERPTVNMDSVVACSPWIEEYTMLGYTQAEPSKESLESLTNPEVRPVPVGSEEAFIEYHTDVTDVSLVFQSMVF